MIRHLHIATLALGLAVPAGAALAHHGWAWTTGGNVELTGVIEQVRLGNPHGLLEVTSRARAGPSRSDSPGATSAPA